jgi:hypothetical protein
MCHQSVISICEQIKIGLLAVSENWVTGLSQVPPDTLLYEDYIETSKKAAKDLRQRGAAFVMVSIRVSMILIERCEVCVLMGIYRQLPTVVLRMTTCLPLKYQTSIFWLAVTTTFTVAIELQEL